MRKLAYGRALVLAAAISGTAFVAPAMAADESPISANVALTTDYVWRGITQTNEEPAIQGGFDYGHSSGLYAGIWGSNVDFGGDETIELDYYVGYGSEAAGLGYDIGAVYYNYPGETDLDWWEVYGSLSKEFGAVSGELGTRLTADYGGTEENGYYVYAAASAPIGAGFNLGGTVGYTDADIDDFEDWIHWQLGVSTSYAGVDLDLSYHDTNLDDADDIADARVVFTVAKSF